MKKNKHLLSLAFLLAAVTTVFLSRMFGRDSQIVEQYYYRGLFQVFRTVYDYTLGFLPIPMMYLFVAVICYILYKLISKLVSRQVSWKARLSGSGHLLLRTICALIILFYWCWGFNYNRQSIESYLNLDSTELDSTELRGLYDQTHRKLISLRSQFSLDEKIADIQEYPTEYENQCRKSLTKALDKLNYPTHGRVRIRRLSPQGSLLRISTAGVYWPFVFEGHIDPGLHPMTWAFTMSHEMGHGYGFTDEGTCNFLGWLACTTHEDPFIQYSGWIGYYRYLLTNLRRTVSREEYQTIYQSMDDLIKHDLSEIRRYAMRYPDIMPDIRDVFYDNYLKTHGVQGGLINYSKIIKLVYAWEKISD